MTALQFIGSFGGKGMLDNHRYRGVAAEAMSIRGAFVQSGDIVIELIELVSDGPSAFRDMYPGKREGLHHVAMFTCDYARERNAFVNAGYPVASEFTVSFGV